MIYNKDALGAATVFDQAYLILDERMRELRELELFPAVTVNCVLACELYLKAMIKNPPHSHKLYTDLFKRLENQSDGIHELIAGQVIAILKAQSLRDENYNYDSFIMELKENEDVFVDWRYFYQPRNDRRDKSANNEFLLIFERVLKATAATKTAEETLGLIEEIQSGNEEELENEQGL